MLVILWNWVEHMPDLAQYLGLEPVFAIATLSVGVLGLIAPLETASRFLELRAKVTWKV